MLNQKGFAHLLLLVLLVAGLAIGLYLVTQTQIFRSRANLEPVVVKSSTGATLPQEGGLPVTESTDIKLELTPPAP